MVLEVAAEFEGRGVTGHPLLWRQERNRIAADLQLLLGDDELEGSGTETRPVPRSVRPAR